jgi:iron complex outermembrane receptor protein
MGSTVRTCLAASVLLAGAGAARVAAADSDATDVTVRGGASGTAAGFVSKADESDATREVTDVASLLEPLPGVHVRRLGADDTFSTLSIRGSTSSEVSMLLAGVPLTGAADPSLDLSSLPLWPGARVRVYRSFTPASIDRGSLGGTLVLEPPRPTDREDTLAWFGLGSFGEERLRLADVRAIDDGRGRLVTSLSASRATDDFSYYDVTHQDFAIRQNAQFAALNGLAAVALPLDLGGGEPGTVTMTALAQSRLQHLPGPTTGPTLLATLSTNREMLSIDVAKPTRVGVVHLLGWTRRDELSAHDSLTSLDPYDVPISNDDVILGAGGAASWRGTVARRCTLETRLDGSFERFSPGEAPASSGAETGATRASTGLGGDLDCHPVERWTLGASGRFDANVDQSDAAGGSAPSPSDRTDLHPTGHVGTEVALGPVALSTHAGVLARPASFIERFGDVGGAVKPNPYLVSESAFTADAGAIYTGKIKKVRARLELVGFATWATDLITFVPVGFGGLKATNIGSARIYGCETSLDVRGYGFDIRAAYTGLATFNDDASQCPGCTSPPPLPGRPAHDAVADIAYGIGPVRVRYGVDYAAGLTQDLAGVTTVPPRLLQSAGVRVSVPWVPTLRLAFEARNLLDVRTATYPGTPPTVAAIGDQYDYPLPGRSVLFTAQWHPRGAGDGTPP